MSSETRVSLASFRELERLWADCEAPFKQRLCDELSFVIEKFVAKEWTHEACIEHMRLWLEHNVT
jgi:hypothetical protein